MTLTDLAKLIRRYIKIVISVPIVCVLVAALILVVLPPTYEAKATLLTNGDIALVSGFAQNEAGIFSQNNITVIATADSTHRTITIQASGQDYGGCIAAANATVLATADDYRSVNEEASITTNEATYAETVSAGILKVGIMALVIGIVFSFCLIVLLDVAKAPIKSRNDAESVSGLRVLGMIPNRDRSERLLANIRFLSEDRPSTIAVVPIGYTGGALTCAELASVFERSGVAVSRIQGNPHAEGFNPTIIPGFITIVECAPLIDGVGSVYIGKEADITILCATEWVDSRKALRAVVEEFRFANANLGGIVLLSSRYSRNGLQ